MKKKKKTPDESSSSHHTRLFLLSVLRWLLSPRQLPASPYPFSPWPDLLSLGCCVYLLPLLPRRSVGVCEALGFIYFWQPARRHGFPPSDCGVLQFNLQLCSRLSSTFLRRDCRPGRKKRGPWPLGAATAACLFGTGSGERAGLRVGRERGA